MKAQHRYKTLCAIGVWLGCTAAAADNWHGSITSKLQVDNRYTNGSSFFAESIGRFEYDNKALALQGGADVLLRGGNYNFNNRQDFYRLFIQKGFSDLNTTVKLGRFEQADAMGFYSLNGINANYLSTTKNLSVDIYAGKPQRFDDLQSAKGDVVAGVKGFWHQDINWRSDWAKFSVDSVDVRAGYYFFRGRDVTQYNPRFPDATPTGEGHKVSLGGNVAGKFSWPWLKQYEARLIAIYRMDTNTMEDLQAEVQMDVTDKTRLRSSYEYYRPNRVANPTFREQFYSQFGFGQQQLLRMSLHHQWQHYFTVYGGGIYSTQAAGDAGYGFNGGISTRYFRNFSFTLEFDHLAINLDDASAIYLKNEYFINSRNSVMLSLALRDENKQLYGNNLVKGTETRWNYMLQSNLILGMTAKYVWNSRLEDEFLTAVQLTYYFDNYKPKEAP